MHACRLGNHYPTKVHSRDAAYPNFEKNKLKDGSVLCGALVSGPDALSDSDNIADGYVVSVFLSLFHSLFLFALALF